MARQNINVGTGPNSLDGDVLRNAFIKINDNFVDLYLLNQAIPSTIEEISSNLLVTGVHTGITATYDSVNHRVNLRGFSGDYNDLINKPYSNVESGGASTVYSPGDQSFDGGSSSALYDPTLINLEGGGA